MKKVLVTTKLLKSNEERISKLWDTKLNLNNTTCPSGVNYIVMEFYVQW